MTKRTRRSLFVSAGLLAAATAADAAATRVAYIDSFATARGNAFTATADNPSAVFYNSAALVDQEGTRIHANLFTFSAQYEYDGPASEDVDDAPQPIPSFFVAHRLENQPAAIGFGAYAPFGLGVDWGEDSVFNTFGLPYDAELAYIKYHAVIAFEISETFSVGLGASFDDGDVSLSSSGPLGSFEGDDQTVGLSLSALWRPNARHSFGLNYQHHTELDFEGRQTDLILPGPTITSSDATASLTFPESIVFGYSWRPTGKWNFEFNLDWTNWDRVDNLQITNDFEVAPLPLDWKSAFIWQLGGTRYFDNGWQLSAGYTFVENAIPDENFLPVVPDSDRHLFAIGTGYTGEHLYWQATYQFSYDDGRKVDGPLPGGTYDLESQALSLSLGYRF